VEEEAHAENAAEAPPAEKEIKPADPISGLARSGLPKESTLTLYTLLTYMQLVAYSLFALPFLMGNL